MIPSKLGRTFFGFGALLAKARNFVEFGYGHAISLNDLTGIAVKAAANVPHLGWNVSLLANVWRNIATHQALDLGIVLHALAFNLLSHAGILRHVTGGLLGMQGRWKNPGNDAESREGAQCQHEKWAVLGRSRVNKTVHHSCG